MSFVVGNKVWFKKAGSTPFVTGDATDPGKAVGSNQSGSVLGLGASSLGGRGKPEVSKKSSALSGLSDAQGTPSIKFTDFPGSTESSDTVLSGPPEPAPDLAPTVATVTTTFGSIPVGVYKYATVFVTAGGDTIPGPTVSITPGIIPTAPTGALAGAGAGNVDNTTHSYKITFVTATGETLPSAASNVVTVADKSVNGQVSLTNIPIGPTGTTGRNIYRTAAGNVAPWKFIATISNSGSTYTDNIADGATASAPTLDTAKYKIQVSGIETGPLGTTARKLCRTAAAGSTLKIVPTTTTLSNNTVGAFLDNTVDGSLGANAVTSEGSLTGSTMTSAGTKLGVTEQTVANPLAPRTVSTQGRWDGATPAALLPDTLDDGKVDLADEQSGVNSIRKIDPNLPYGRPANTKGIIAQGTSIPVSGTQDFVSETIDVKGTTVGLRLPSSEEAAGVVVQLVTVQNGGKTPDGTAVRAGDKLYWVNWGAADSSNPHKVKWQNRAGGRVSVHAEADLVAA